ncbi:hypothetical protein N2152v2_003843 [Parachlorella kessleri]
MLVESGDSKIQADDYVIVNGYRFVKPYHFDFMCNVRQRWFGQNIVDIMSREFPARDRQYYLAALADGRLRVEGREATAETALSQGMRIRHFIHRHEPPVPAGPIQVVGETADIVAVNKPHGMPVHVAGQYRKNTVHGILAAERADLGELLPVHRLDKPVSGLLLFARHAAAAEALRQQIESRCLEKVYVARVLGAFPSSDAPIAVDVPLAWDPVTNNARAVPEAAARFPSQAASRAAAAGQGQSAEQGVQAAAPAAAAGAGRLAEAGVEGGGHGVEMQAQQREEQQQQEQQQQGAEQQQGDQQRQQQQEDRRLRKAKWKALKREKKAAREAAAAAAAAASEARERDAILGAKPALTEYRLLWVAPDGQTSLVECRPRTGRTHQIRVHLQHLGHPIANDVQYGGTYGGPLPSQTMADELGVSWGKRRQAGDHTDGNNAAAGAATEGGAALGVAAAALVAADAPVAGAGDQGQVHQHQQLRHGGGTCCSGGHGAKAGSTAAGAGAMASNGSVTIDVTGADEGVAPKRPRTDGTCAAQRPRQQHQRGQPDGQALGVVDCPGHRERGSMLVDIQQQSAQADSLEGLLAAASSPCDAYQQNEEFRSRPEYKAPAELHDKLCINCPYFAPRDYPLDLRPLWLHARSYSSEGGQWSFSCDLPGWARADFVPQRS